MISVSNGKLRRKKNCFGPIRSLFSFSIARKIRGKNSFKQIDENISWIRDTFIIFELPTFWRFKSYVGISQSKKTLSNLVIAPKCSTFITLFSTVTTFCTDTPVQAKYCTLGTGKGFQLPTIFLVIVVVFVLKLKRQHVYFCCFLTVSQNCGSLSSNSRDFLSTRSLWL